MRGQDSSLPPVIPARPRRKRQASAIEQHLRVWGCFVRQAEKDRRSRRTTVVCYCYECTCFDRYDIHPRDALEGIIRRGGKAGRRVAKAIAPLDERFCDATELSYWHVLIPDGRWWHARLPPDALETDWL
jgi:hypothetical protein